jgi:hypothetical protein
MEDPVHQGGREWRGMEAMKGREGGVGCWREEEVGGENEGSDTCCVCNVLSLILSLGPIEVGLDGEKSHCRLLQRGRREATERGAMEDREGGSGHWREGEEGGENEG